MERLAARRAAMAATPARRARHHPHVPRPAIEPAPWLRRRREGVRARPRRRAPARPAPQRVSGAARRVRRRRAVGASPQAQSGAAPRPRHASPRVHPALRRRRVVETRPASVVRRRAGAVADAASVLGVVARDRLVVARRVRRARAASPRRAGVRPVDAGLGDGQPLDDVAPGGGGGAQSVPSARAASRRGDALSRPRVAAAVRRVRHARHHGARQARRRPAAQPIHGSTGRASRCTCAPCRWTTRCASRTPAAVATVDDVDRAFGNDHCMRTPRDYWRFHLLSPSATTTRRAWRRGTWRTSSRCRAGWSASARRVLHHRRASAARTPAARGRARAAPRRRGGRREHPALVPPLDARPGAARRARRGARRGRGRGAAAGAAEEGTRARAARYDASALRAAEHVALGAADVILLPIVSRFATTAARAGRCAARGGAADVLPRRAAARVLPQAAERCARCAYTHQYLGPRRFRDRPDRPAPRAMRSFEEHGRPAAAQLVAGNGGVIARAGGCRAEEGQRKRKRECKGVFDFLWRCLLVTVIVSAFGPATTPGASSGMAVTPGVA